MYVQVMVEVQRELVVDGQDLTALGIRWQALLQTSGKITNILTTDAGNVFVAQSPAEAQEILEFFLDQAETLKVWAIQMRESDAHTHTHTHTHTVM